jgi:hypothetical protein
MQFLKPHTKKWFAAVARFNPWQAAQTMALLQTARTRDVCSFCGAGPAAIYSLSKNDTEQRESGTFRLCRNCIEVRQRSFGERVLSFVGSAARRSNYASLRRASV